MCVSNQCVFPGFLDSILSMEPQGVQTCLPALGYLVKKDTGPGYRKCWGSCTENGVAPDWRVEAGSTKEGLQDRVQKDEECPAGRVWEPGGWVAVQNSCGKEAGAEAQGGNQKEA